MIPSSGETDLQKLLKALNPELNPGDYVFCSVPDLTRINIRRIIMSFKENGAVTLILSKGEADKLRLRYTFIAAWITLTVHSSLHAVGLTALFSNALAKQGISCNVVAAFHHDHIFVDRKDAKAAMEILNSL